MRMSLDGVYKPSIKLSKCKDCGLCKKVCPTFSFDQNLMITNTLGHFISCYIGYSNDTEIRWNSASGGLATTILLFMLKKGIINGAIVVINNIKDPLKPLMSFVKTEEDLRTAMGSKYCPVKPHFKVRDLVNEEGNMAVVGLPCHIWAFKKLEEINEKLRQKIVIHIGLFCGKCPNFYATIYFLRKVAGVNEDNVAKLSYRGKGWPGKITVETRQGCNYTFELNDWCQFSYYPHFIPIHCMTCYDITNQQADLSLGDAWGLVHDRIGTSVIITRTSRGERLLQQLYDEGKIVLRKVSPERVYSGQELEVRVRKTLIRSFLWWKIFKQPVSHTTFTLHNLSVKDYLFNFVYCIWFYASQNPLIRTMLCNLTPYITKLKEFMVWENR